MSAKSTARLLKKLTILSISETASPPVEQITGLFASATLSKSGQSWLEGEPILIISTPSRSIKSTDGSSKSASASLVEINLSIYWLFFRFLKSGWIIESKFMERFISTKLAEEDFE